MDERIRARELASSLGIVSLGELARYQSVLTAPAHRGRGPAMGVIDEIADSVLLAVESVPPGRVVTYGRLARLVGRGGPRVIARVMSTRGGDVPWWRVVRADGTIAPQLVAQATPKLAAEGVVVRDGRVDLARFGVPDDDHPMRI